MLFASDCPRPSAPLAASRQPFFRGAARPAPRLCRAAEPARSAVERRASVTVEAREKSGFAKVEPAPDSKEAHAKLNYQRGSPHKVRRVLDTIRGKSYVTALMILEYMPYRACEKVQKTMISAANNARDALGMDKANLMVSECYADMGPNFRRIRGGFKGRPYSRLKPGYHLTIKVKEMVKSAEAPAPPAAVAAEAAAPAAA